MKEEQSLEQKTLIEAYDSQLNELYSKRRRLVEERNSLKKNNEKHSQCYNDAVNAKNQLGNAFDNIVNYCKTNREKVDSNVKIMKELYDFIAQSTNDPKISNQFNNINDAIKSVSNTFNIVESQINVLNNQIYKVDMEIERIKAQRGGVING